MPVKWGQRKRSRMTAGLTGIYAGSPACKIGRVNWGKREKQQQKTLLTNSNNSTDFANIYRAERINIELTMDENNSNIEENQEETIQKTDEQKKIEAILAEQKVQTLTELRTKAAKISIEADKLKTDLSDEDQKQYEELIKKHGTHGSIAANLGDKGPRLPVKTYVLRRLAEELAREKVERITEIQQAERIRVLLGNQTAQAEEAQRLAKEELVRVTSCDALGVFIFIYIYFFLPQWWGANRC